MGSGFVSWLCLRSVKDRRQERPIRLVVQAKAHKRQVLDDAKAVLRTPMQQLIVAARRQDSGTGVRWRRCDQCL